MFDLLKKKLGNFTEKVKKKIEKAEVQQAQPEKGLPEKSFEEALPPKEEIAVEEEPIQEKEAEARTIEEPESLPEEEPEQLQEEEAVPEKPGEIEVRPAEEKRELKPKVSVKGRLKAAFTGSVELKEHDLKELLEELELSLLESDVEQETAGEICKKIGERLAGRKVSRKENVEGFVKKEISDILLEMMKAGKIDLVKAASEKEEKPFKVLFLGPNGAGKTTSIAKLTWLLQEKGLKVIWAASDTFRAASIEQLEKHAKKLGVRVIKHQYGSDPAAVAFDAVKAAESRKIDVVLVDSAGRQETNRNLMGELQKIARVMKPDLKIFVGESYTGQSLLQQAQEYDRMVGIDGFILTKIDCDSKGGTTISLLYKIGKPVLFVGTGQEYRDLMAFEPGFVLERVLG